MLLFIGSFCQPRFNLTGARGGHQRGVIASACVLREQRSPQRCAAR
jgi:hypothetical protein